MKIMDMYQIIGFLGIALVIYMFVWMQNMYKYIRKISISQSVLLKVEQAKAHQTDLKINIDTLIKEVEKKH